MADATGVIRLDATNIDQTNKMFNDLVKSMRSTERMVMNVEHSFDNLQHTLTSITSSKFKDTLITYNKSLFEMSRQASVTGVSYNSLKLGMDNLNKSTSFSITESTKFYKQVMDGTRGLKMSAGAVNDLAKALQMEYGPALEDVTAALGDLMEVQNKDVDIFERMRRGMSTKEVVSLAQSYQDLGIVTAKQAESLIRTSSAMNDSNRELTEQEKKLRKAHEAQQQLTKSWDNVKLNWAEKLNDLLPKIDSMLSSIAGTLNAMPKGMLEKLFAVTMVGGAYLGGKALVSKASGLLGPVGGGGSVTDKVKSLMTGAPSTGTGKGDVVNVKLVGIDLNQPIDVKDKTAAGPSGTSAAAASGAGKWYNNGRVRAGMAGAAIAFGGGMLADSMMTSNWKTGEKEHTRGSAGVSAASNIASSAMMGFSVAGPWGAAAGAAVGLISSFDTLNIALKGTAFEFKGFSEMMGFAKDNAEKLEKETGRRASEPGMWRKGTAAIQEAGAKYSPAVMAVHGIKNAINGEGSWNPLTWSAEAQKNTAEHTKQQVDFDQGQEVYGDLIEKKYKGQGKTYESMSISSDPKEWGALDQLKGQMRDAHKIEGATGVNMKDDKFAEAAMKYDLAQQAARGTGLKKQKDIDSAAQSLISGKASTTSDLYMKYAEKQKDEKARSIASSRVKDSMGDIVDPSQMSAANKNIKDGAGDINMKRLGYNQALAQFELVKTVLESSIASSDKLAENALRFGNNQGKASTILEQNVLSYGTQIKQMDDIINKQKELIGDQAAGDAARMGNMKFFEDKINEEYEMAIKTEMAKNGGNRGMASTKVKDKDTTPDAIRGKMQEQLTADAALLKKQGERADLVQKEADARLKLVDIAAREKSLIDAKSTLLQSEMDLTRSMYLGLGPAIDTQLKMIDLQEQKIDAIDREIEKTQELLSKNKEDVELQKKLAEKQTEKNQAVMKELEITKGLREGYLEAMSAFTNVSGSFSKIILKKEMGAAQMMREFAGPGGLKMGGLGAGATGPMAQWGAGGKLNMASSDEYNQIMRSYTEEYMPGSRSKPSQAALIKDQNLEEVAAAGKLGAGPSALPSTGAATSSGSVGSGKYDVDMAGSVSKGIDDSKLAKFIIEEWTKAHTIVSAAGTTTGATAPAAGKTPPLLAGTTGTGAKTEGAKVSDAIAPDEKDKPGGIKDIVGKIVGPELKAKKAISSETIEKALSAVTEAKKGMTDDKERQTADHIEAGLIAEKNSMRLNDKLKSDEKAFKESMKRKPVVDGYKFGRSNAKDNRDNFGNKQQMGFEKQINDKTTAIGRIDADISYFQEQAKSPNKDVARRAQDKLDHYEKEKFRLGIEKTRLESQQQFVSPNKKGSLADIGAIPNVANSSKEEAKEKIAGEIAKTQDKIEMKKKDLTNYTGSSEGYDKESSKLDNLEKRLKEQLDTQKKIESSSVDQVDTQKKIEGETTKQTNQLEKISEGSGDPAASGGMSNPMVFNSDTNLQDVVNGWLGGGGSAGGIGFAEGGVVGGTGSGDTVPAMLTPKEFVVNEKAAKKYGKLLTVLNGNKFSMGGFVGGGAHGDMGLSIGGGGGGSPNIQINVKGDSVDKIMSATMRQLHQTVNKMVTPHGSTSRYFDKGRS